VSTRLRVSSSLRPQRGQFEIDRRIPFRAHPESK
jgi:hypothetical protein